jgi:hypothetical protein
MNEIVARFFKSPGDLQNRPIKEYKMNKKIIIFIIALLSLVALISYLVFRQNQLVISEL